MIRSRVWVCPHHYVHTYRVIVMPRSAVDSPPRVVIEPADGRRPCRWCLIRRRVKFVGGGL